MSGHLTGPPGADDPVREAQAWLAARDVTGTQVGLAEPEAGDDNPHRAGVPESGLESGSNAGLDPGSNAGSGRDLNREPDPDLGSDLGPNEDPEAVARTIALRLLTTRARTRDELREALRRRQVPTDAAESVLARLESVGLLNDSDFARQWVSSRQQRRSLSRTALRHELRRKGLASDHVDAALAEVSGDDERAAAAALISKRIAGMTALEPHTRYRRLAQMLARRGFPAGVITAVLPRPGGPAVSSEDA